MAGIYAVRELDCVTIEYLYVEEKHRGRGYGSQLLERIEQQARAAGAKRIFLNTFSFQAPAFYEKHGYQLLPSWSLRWQIIINIFSKNYLTWSKL